MRALTHDSQEYVVDIQKNLRAHYVSESMKLGTRGKWSDQETITYFNFLLKQRRMFQKPGERKRNQIFLKMSKFLGTRSPDQCRSHHQKIQNYAKTKQIDGICQYLLEKLSHIPNYSELRLDFEKSGRRAETKEMEDGIQIRKQSYLISGNERGCFNVVVNMEALIKW